MGHQNRFVDLKLLVVRPDATQEDLLQIALEGFDFGKITNVPNAESARDQLYFNDFDLVIMVSDMIADTCVDLLDSLGCGELGTSTTLPVLCVSKDKEAALQNGPLENLQVCEASLSIRALNEHLQKMIHLAKEIKSQPENTPSRVSRQMPVAANW